MKTLIFTFVLSLALVVTSSFATVRTCSNNSLLPAQFSSLQSAVDASASGDSIYVMGSATSYGTVSIGKRVVIIGNGLNPYGVTKPKSVVDYVNIHSPSDGAADGLTLVGLTIVNDLRLGTTDGNTKSAYGVNGVAVSRCAINAINARSANTSTDPTTPYSDLIVLQSIIYGMVNQDNFNSISCSNTNFIGSTMLFGGFATGAYLYNNCNFLFTSNGSGLGYYYGTLSYTLIQNSVIVKSAQGNFNSCIFRNCITYQNINNNIASSGVVLDNCLINQDPKFVLVPGYGTGWFNSSPLSQIFDITYCNLGYQAGSPGLNAGLDGTNIGPSGGANSFNYLKQDAATLPRMVDVSILSGQTLPQTGGNISVRIKAKKQD